MIEFSGCGQENKFILEKKDKDIKTFFSLVTNNTQVRSRRSEDLEKTLTEFGKLPEAKCKVVGSATDGLFFSLLSSGLKAGSKIGVTAYSFHASASCIVRAGHIPIFIDVDFNGLTNLEDFEKIAKDLDCIVIVNLFGHKIHEKKFLNICTNFNVLRMLHKDTFFLKLYLALIYAYQVY
jgi:dTDP-4-amino-4,6-dideoxygalactose transaminase